MGSGASAMSPVVNATSPTNPYWSYADLGIFLLVLSLLAVLLRVLMRLHLLPSSQLSNPSARLQILVALVLTGTLYLILRLHYWRPVVKPLGWTRPAAIHVLLSLGTGGTLALVVLLYQRVATRDLVSIASPQVLVLATLVAPVLEESLFRGCLFPLIAQRIGNASAVFLSATVFALFHGPVDWAHGVSFALAGIAYGWLRVISATTTAPALAHAAYNLTLLSAAALS